MNKKDKRESEEEYGLYEDGFMMLFSLTTGLLTALIALIILTVLL